MFKKQILLVLSLMLLGAGCTKNKPAQNTVLNQPQLTEVRSTKLAIIDEIDLTPQLTTSTWKIYQDAETGLVFKYPSDGIVFNSRPEYGGPATEIISNFSADPYLTFLKSGQYAVVVNFPASGAAYSCKNQSAVEGIKNFKTSNREVLVSFTNEPVPSYSACIPNSITSVLEVQVKTNDISLAKNIFDTISFSKPPATSYPPFKTYKRYGLYGILEPEGYLRIDHWACEPGDMCERSVDYASFVITSEAGIDSQALQNFFGENEGNSFVGERSIGLGCYDKTKQIIHSVNEGDMSKASNIISGTSLQKLLNSSKDKPARLRLVRPIYTSGKGAPDCYSHFRDFKVL